ncbi:MAG TPA: 4'-phosphopantetheinyl transferase superfamily protein [Mizugakiibacter sp.]
MDPLLRAGFREAPPPAPLGALAAPAVHWTAPLAAPWLGRDELHVWRIDLDAAEADDHPALDAHERARAARFAFPRDRRRYVAAHAALRRILGRYVGVAAATLPLYASGTGKPMLALADAPAFNLSHAGGLALLAVGHVRALGIDVEAVRPLPDAELLARRCFTPAECVAIAATAPQRRALAVMTCWTRKEALLKATGDGLGRDPAGIHVGADAGPRRVAVPAGGHTPPWSVALHTFRPAPGHVAAYGIALGDAPASGDDPPVTHWYTDVAAS